MRARALGGPLLALVSLAVTFGAMELLARWAAGRRSAPVAAEYTIFDPLLGWKHRPGARGRYGHGDYAINSAGLRDLERPVDADPAVDRVMVLGDSFAEGFSVALEDSVSRRLERELRGAGCNAEAINAGTVGYSTDQEYLFYREDGARWSPRVVTLLFYHNDIMQNARAEAVKGTPKPLFSFRGGTPRVMNAPLPPARPFEAGRPEYWRGSAALTWTRTRIRDGAPRLYDALARLRFWSPVRPADVPSELQVYEASPPRSVSDAWGHTEHLLRALRTEVARHGARLLVAYVPSRMEVSRDDWELTLARYRVQDGRWDRRMVARRLESVAGRLDIPFLDLTDALWTEHAKGRDVYIPRGGHWNADGHAVAARSLAAVLRDQRWLRCSARETRN